MASEAEKQAIENAVVRDLTNQRVEVNDWLSGSYVKELSADGAEDIVRFVRANGWEFSREPAAKPVEEDEFVRKADGIPVSLAGAFLDRALSREGAKALWDDIAQLKWYVGKVAE